VGLSDSQIDQTTWEGRDRPLSHFPLLAPFAGTIIERHITMGELITPENTPFTIADLRTVWVLLDIYEKDIARIGSGAAARVAVDAYPGEVFSGQLTYLSRVVDPATRSAEARVEIDNRDGRLRPGMFATATVALPASGGEAVLVAPRDAVQQVRGGPVAFVEEKPGTYAMRELVLGRESGPSVEIRSGLAAGEPVVTDGAFYLKSTVLKEEMVGHED
jgi:cobalt-zinc-cadmium efflux system membrane fusion protein